MPPVGLPTHLPAEKICIEYAHFFIACSLPDLPNQTYQTKLILPNLPKLLVKAVNAWVCSAFGNVCISFSPAKRLLWAKLTNQFLTRFPVFSHGIQVHPMPSKLLITPYNLRLCFAEKVLRSLFLCSTSFV